MMRKDRPGFPQSFMSCMMKKYWNESDNHFVEQL